MNKEVYGALKRIIEEVKEYRKAECMIKDFPLNNIIRGNDVDLIECWFNKVTEE